MIHKVEYLDNCHGCFTCYDYRAGRRRTAGNCGRNVKRTFWVVGEDKWPADHRLRFPTKKAALAYAARIGADA